MAKKHNTQGEKGEGRRQEERQINREQFKIHRGRCWARKTRDKAHQHLERARACVCMCVQCVSVWRMSDCLIRCADEFVRPCVRVRVIEGMHEGCRYRWGGGMSGPRADPGNTVHQGGRWTGEMGERGGDKEKREKKREIQGEMLLSLPTKIEVRQGQTVRDYLTVASCTRVAYTSPSPLKIILGSSLLCRATSYTTAHLRLGESLGLRYD